MHFNHKLGVPLDKRAFEGWSVALGGGYAWGSGLYVRAYKDSELHLPGMPGNPPVLYWGIMGGYATGVKVGAMLTFSKAKLLDSWSIQY